MPCKKPIRLFVEGHRAEGPISWNEARRCFGSYVEIGCYWCSVCRYARTKEWALRCALEAKSHKQMSFLNLTYRTPDLPEGGTLVKRHCQDFLRALRYRTGVRFRYYLSGEYGSLKGRPHYHVLVFGVAFEDQYPWRMSGTGHQLYRSELAEKCWPYGHVEIGTVTLNSAKYVAGYIRKKIVGDEADNHYEGRLPEFSLMSLKPGIGVPWYEANKDMMFREGFIRVDGRSYHIPRYFRQMYEKENPEGYADYMERKPEIGRRMNVDPGGHEYDVVESPFV